MVSVEITAGFAALLAIIQIAFTLRVGLFRRANAISLGDGGSDEMLKRIRAHANFIETVPMALMLLLLNELSGTSTDWLYGFGIALVTARILHYAAVAFALPLACRFIGMMGTLLTILVSAIVLVV